MTVSQPLGKSLEARSSWCQPNESIVWTFPQVSLRYDVEGLDLSGNSLPGWGKRAGKNIKRAAATVGDATLAMGLTAVFGGGEDSGRNTGGRSSDDLPDVIVFGENPDSKASRLLPLEKLAQLTNSAEVNLDNVQATWILTTRRLGLTITEEDKNESTPEGQRQKTGSSSIFGRAKSIAEKSLREFGENQVREPLRSNNLHTFLEVDRQEISGFDLPHRELDPKYRRDICFRLILSDNSGFDFCGRHPQPNNMMEMTMGRA